MAQATVAILGGAGNTGRRMARLLARTGLCDLRLMGRTKASVDDAAARIAAETGSTLVGVAIDSSDRAGLLRALSGADLVVSATSATPSAATVATVALQLGIDYFDIHLSSAAKWRALRAIEPEVVRRGLQFVSDGGFHPGVAGGHGAAAGGRRRADARACLRQLQRRLVAPELRPGGCR